MALTAPTVIFVCSLCGIPVAYIVNTFPILNSETGLFFSGVIVLIGMCVITYFGAKQKDKKPVDPFLYGKKTNFCITKLNTYYKYCSIVRHI